MTSYLPATPTNLAARHGPTGHAPHVSGPFVAELAQALKRPYKPQVGLRRAGDACHARFPPSFFPRVRGKEGWGQRPDPAINYLQIAPASGRRDGKKVMDS